MKSSFLCLAFTSAFLSVGVPALAQSSGVFIAPYAGLVVSVEISFFLLSAIIFVFALSSLWNDYWGDNVWMNYKKSAINISVPLLLVVPAQLMLGSLIEQFGFFAIASLAFNFATAVVFLTLMPSFWIIGKQEIKDQAKFDEQQKILFNSFFVDNEPGN